jgi:RNA polymerase sigma-70 factor (ECF subfamily)
LDRTDWTLVEEIKSGNLESFNELMLRYQDSVFQITRSFTKDNEDALDLSQNEGNNWARKNKKGTMEAFDEQTTGKTSEMLPDDNYLVNENRTALLRCLFELNTKYRLAVILRYFENYSIKEIAATLGCSEAVVKNILFRSLQKLRDRLNDYHQGVN